MFPNDPKESLDVFSKQIIFFLVGIF